MCAKFVCWSGVKKRKITNKRKERTDKKKRKGKKEEEKKRKDKKKKEKKKKRNRIEFLILSIKVYKLQYCDYLS